MISGFFDMLLFRGDLFNSEGGKVLKIQGFSSVSETQNHILTCLLCHKTGHL